jgi:hypothetical protein
MSAKHKVPTDSDVLTGSTVFTPTLVFTTPGTTPISVTSASAQYVRIDRRIEVIFSISFDKPVGFNGSGSLILGGLPVIPSSIQYGPVIRTEGLIYPTGYNALYPTSYLPGSLALTWYPNAAGTVGTPLDVAAAHMTLHNAISGSLVYLTA